MGGLFGGGKQSVQNSAPIIGNLRVQTSAQGKPIPFAQGKTRIPVNLLWYADFTAISHTESSSAGGGGKGGGSVTTESTTYTYTAAVIMSLCEGPVARIARVWRDKDRDSLAGAGLNFFSGDYSQVAYGYVTTHHPEAALAYRGLAYVAAGAYSLGSNAQLGNHTFEIETAGQQGSTGQSGLSFTRHDGTTLSVPGHAFADNDIVRVSSSGTLLGGLTADLDYYVVNADTGAGRLGLAESPNGSPVTIGTGSGTQTIIRYIPDMNVTDVIETLVGDADVGLGKPGLVGDYADAKDYCIAAGVFVSPAYTEQEPAAQVIQRLADIANAGVFWSEDQLKLRPFADEAVTGNGVTFTPDLTPVASVDDDDLLDMEQPILLKRSAPDDAFNQKVVKFFNRLNDYNEEPATASDQVDIEDKGLKADPDELQYREIVDPGTARVVVQQALQKGLYSLRNRYTLKVGWKFDLVEPMDVLAITDADLGLDAQLVLVEEITDDENEELTLTVREVVMGAGTAERLPHQGTVGYAANYNVAPGAMNAPILFVGPYALTEGYPEVWMGLSGAAGFGGCEIWASYDNSNYKRAGVFYGRSRMGVTQTVMDKEADPDEVTTLRVDLSMSAGELSPASQSEANKLTTLCYAGGELFAFRDADLVSANVYDLAGLRRSAYGAPLKYVASGEPFLRVDDSIFRLRFPWEFQNRDVYFKFLPFNVYGAARLGLADVSPVTFRLTQKFAGVPTVPNVSGLSLVGTDGNEFAGADCDLEWRGNSNLLFQPFGSEVFGSGSSGKDPTFKDYLIAIRTTDWEEVGQPKTAEKERWTYSLLENRADNLADGRSGPLRQFRVLVWQRGQMNQVSKAGAHLLVNNPVPVISDMAFDPTTDGLRAIYTRPTDPDFKHIEICLSTVAGFTPDPDPDTGNLAYIGRDIPAIVRGLVSSQVYYGQWRVSDDFGPGDWSGEFTFTTLRNVQANTSGTPSGSTLNLNAIGSTTSGHVVLAACEIGGYPPAPPAILEADFSGKFTCGASLEVAEFRWSAMAVSSKPAVAGTVAVSLAGSTTYDITGTGTTFTDYAIGDWLYLGHGKPLFRFTAITTATAAQAVMVTAGPTGAAYTASGLSYTVYRGAALTMNPGNGRDFAANEVDSVSFGAQASLASAGYSSIFVACQGGTTGGNAIDATRTLVRARWIQGA